MTNLSAGRASTDATRGPESANRSAGPVRARGVRPLGGRWLGSGILVLVLLLGGAAAQAQSADVESAGCDARKAAATMAVTRHLSRCVGREQRGSGIGPRCSGQARARFEQLISRIEAHGGCARTGDAAALLDVATRFVEELDQVSRARTVTTRATPAPAATSTGAHPSAGAVPTAAGSPEPTAMPHVNPIVKEGTPRASPAR